MLWRRESFEMRCHGEESFEIEMDRERESWVRDREIERERAGFEIEIYGEERASRERASRERA